jgi:hypothetical protein
MRKPTGTRKRWIMASRNWNAKLPSSAEEGWPKAGVVLV